MADLLCFPIERTRRPGLQRLAEAALAAWASVSAEPMGQAEGDGGTQVIGDGGGGCLQVALPPSHLMGAARLPRPCWADKVHLPDGTEGWND